MKTIVRKTSKTLIAGILLATSTLAMGRMPVELDSGREGGGIPPRPNSTQIVFNQSLANGILDSVAWQSVQTLLAAQPNVCVKAYYEDRGNGELKVVGATPEELRETAASLGLSLSADIALNGAGHHKFCESLQHINVNDGAAKDLMLEALKNYGEVTTRHSFTSMYAESVTCVGPWAQEPDTAPACYMTVNGTNIVRMDDDISARIFHQLESRGNIRKLHGDAYFVRNLSCSEMEVMNPMARLMLCTVEAPMK